MEVLLAVDGSEYTKHMLAYLAAHEELLGKGNVFTALTVTLAIPARITRFVDKATVDGYYVDEAEEVFKPIRAFAQQQHWELSTTQLQGPAADAIAGYARDTKPDLLVMGTRGHSSLASVVMGSTVTGVLGRCQVPVLLVR